MSFLSFLGGALTPLTNLIDNLHTSEEEKLTIKQKFFEVQSQLYAQALESENRLAEAKAKIITAEAQSEGWITKSWRPITMLTFLGIILYQAVAVSMFGAPPISMESIPDQMWNLLQIGIGGYIASRGLEKIVPAVSQAIGK